MNKCKDREGRCFARRRGNCLALNDCPEKCSFKKPEADVTNGVRYPYNPASCAPDDNSLRAMMRRHDNA